jgi:hypothetical protein
MELPQGLDEGMRQSTAVHASMIPVEAFRGMSGWPGHWQRQSWALKIFRVLRFQVRWAANGVVAGLDLARLATGVPQLPFADGSIRVPPSYRRSVAASALAKHPHLFPVRTLPPHLRTRRPRAPLEPFPPSLRHLCFFRTFDHRGIRDRLSHGQREHSRLLEAPAPQPVPIQLPLPSQLSSFASPIDYRLLPPQAAIPSHSLSYNLSTFLQPVKRRQDRRIESLRMRISSNKDCLAAPLSTCPPL